MLARDEFVARFGGIFEHSPWVAERAFDATPDISLTSDGVHEALVAPFRAASQAERLAVLQAHPDLAGKLAIAGGLTEDSRADRKSTRLNSSHS